MLEAGLRQAWFFLNFGSPEERVERRLYIDTDFWVRDSTGAQMKGPELNRLGDLVNLVVTEINTRHGKGAGLRIRFDNGSSLEISDEPTPATTHDVWWLSDPLP